MSKACFPSHEERMERILIRRDDSIDALSIHLMEKCLFMKEKDFEELIKLLEDLTNVFAHS